MITRECRQIVRIALLADIHGNDVALEAVLKDIEQRGGADAYWVLGDLVAIGHAPVKVLERLVGLSDVRFVRGNTDRYVCTGARPEPSVEAVRVNLDLLPTLLAVEADFSWTQGAITIGGWYEWLSKLPLEFQDELPDGTVVLAVHAAPGRDDGTGIRPEMIEADVEILLSECEADLICVGHTHYPLDIQVGDKRLVNPGSVSNPVVDGNTKANYAMINVDEAGYWVEHRQVQYDYERVIAILEQINHPAKSFISGHFAIE